MSRVVYCRQIVLKLTLCTHPSSHIHTAFDVVCTGQMDGWSTIDFMEMLETSQKQAPQKHEQIKY